MTFSLRFVSALCLFFAACSVANIIPRRSVPIPEALQAHRDLVSCVAFNDDGSLLASGSADRTILLWDVASGRAIGRPLAGHQGSVESVAFSPDGKTLASGSSDGVVLVWDVGSQKSIRPALTGHRKAVNSLAFTPEGRMLASGSADRTVVLWEVATWQPLGAPLEHPQGVSTVAFNSDGQTLAVVTKSTILFWSVSTRREFGPRLKARRSRLLDSEFRDAAFSPGGGLLATAGISQSASDPTKAVAIWNLATREVFRELSGQFGFALAVAFSPDGKTLASGGADGTIVLWDVAAGSPIGEPLTGHGSYGWPSSPEWIKDLAFSPDGRILASAGGGSVILWDVQTRQPIAREPN